MSPYIIPGLKFHDGKLRKKEIIISAVCNYYQIPYSTLIKKCRDRDLIKARHTLCYLLRKHTALSLTQVAKLFNQDHTSVMHAIDKITGFLDIKDAEVMEAVHFLEEKIST